jgi:hypothetical protein
MPAATKPKKPTAPSTSIVIWRRGSIDVNGNYRNGAHTLNYQVQPETGPVAAEIHTILPGLDTVPRHAWDRAVREAKNVAALHPDRGHPLLKAIDGRQLVVIDSIDQMSDEDAQQALEQTASKSMLQAVAEGKHGARHAAKAAEIKATWGRRDIPKVRKITAHFASYQRA